MFHTSLTYIVQIQILKISRRKYMHCIKGNFRHVFNFNFTWISSNDLRLLSLNKRPMGHIAHLRKQFKSLKTYDYNVKRKKQLHENWLVLHLKDAFCQVWKKLAQCFWRRGFFFYFVNAFSLFRNYIPLKKGRTLYLDKLKSLSSKDAWCNFVNVFLVFCNHLPLDNGRTPSFVKLKSPSSNDAFAKFGWN